MSLESGYKFLLEGKLIEAKEIFAKLKECDPRADWAWILVQFIEKDVRILPTYLQVRNFLEIDLALLIEAGQSKSVENIINYSDLLFTVNPEIYKCIARVMIYYNFQSVAEEFLKRGKEQFYLDPELHVMLAKCALSHGNLAIAIKHANTALEVMPEYYPALNFLKKYDK